MGNVISAALAATTAPANGTGPSMPMWQWILIEFGICMGVFISIMQTTVLSPAMEPIEKAIRARPGQPDCAALAYNLAFIAFASFMVSLADVSGRLFMYFLSAMLYIFASLACGIVRTVIPLMVLRALQGIGGSGLYGIGAVIATEVTPISMIQFNSACFGFAIAVAGVCGPLIGGAIAKLKWNWIFWMNCLIITVSMTMVMYSLPRNGRARLHLQVPFRRIDFFGHLLFAIISVLPITALQLIGINLYTTSTPGVTLFSVLMSIGVVCLVALAFWERCQTQVQSGRSTALVPMSFMRNGAFAATLIAIFFNGWIYFAIVFGLPLRLTIVNKFTSARAGLALASVLPAVALGCITASLCSRKLNRTTLVMTLAAVPVLIGTALLTWLGDIDSVRTDPISSKVLLALLALGFGLGLTISSATLVASFESGLWDYGSAHALLGQLLVFGGTLGVAVNTALVGVADLKHQILQLSWLHAYRTTMIICSALAGVVLVIMLVSSAFWPTRYPWVSKQKYIENQMSAWTTANPPPPPPTAPAPHTTLQLALMHIGFSHQAPAPPATSDVSNTGSAHDLSNLPQPAGNQKQPEGTEGQSLTSVSSQTTYATGSETTYATSSETTDTTGGNTTDGDRSYTAPNDTNGYPRPMSVYQLV
ncbi:MFS general substrate transporter [Eremomyces bilateralis CBS 781.70]|uniref:MFS general substrate transporter n=1 Tax=Eremomyces bilateralis CBS 781.70 TaxID=1392243 RepID=A0A6G1G8E1_9PEZI|nr:MFS general substrate transporter [Eremomyces bilateralis CBS 781.70]KAF1814191.1 MFS general substrate transporter [Eremomyces bilateralis CBS 781.70]